MKIRLRKAAAIIVSLGLCVPGGDVARAADGEITSVDLEIGSGDAEAALVPASSKPAVASPDIAQFTVAASQELPAGMHEPPPVNSPARVRGADGGLQTAVQTSISRAPDPRREHLSPQATDVDPRGQLRAAKAAGARAVEDAVADHQAAVRITGASHRAGKGFDTPASFLEVEAADSIEAASAESPADLYGAVEARLEAAHQRLPLTYVASGSGRRQEENELRAQLRSWGDPTMAAYPLAPGKSSFGGSIRWGFNYVDPMGLMRVELGPKEVIRLGLMSHEQVRDLQRAHLERAREANAAHPELAAVMRRLEDLRRLPRMDEPLHLRTFDALTRVFETQGGWRQVDVMGLQSYDGGVFEPLLSPEMLQAYYDSLGLLEPAAPAPVQTRNPVTELVHLKMSIARAVRKAREGDSSEWDKLAPDYERLTERLASFAIKIAALFRLTQVASAGSGTAKPLHRLKRWGFFGAGPGLDEKAMAKLGLLAGKVVYAFDFGKKVLEVNRTSVAGLGEDVDHHPIQVNVVKDRVPLADGSLDVAETSLMESIQDPAEHVHLLTEMNRTLDMGGYLILTLRHGAAPVELSRALQEHLGFSVLVDGASALQYSPDLLERLSQGDEARARRLREQISQGSVLIAVKTAEARPGLLDNLSGLRSWAEGRGRQTPVLATISPYSTELDYDALQEEVEREARAKREPGLVDEIRRDPERLFALYRARGIHLTRPQEQFIREVLIPQAGFLSVMTDANTLRGIAAGPDWLRLEGFPKEQSLEVLWEAGRRQPGVEWDDDMRYLLLPLTGAIAEHSRGAWIRRWLIGSSLHPLMSSRALRALRWEVGDPEFTPRAVQVEGVEAALETYKRGGGSFLYIAPTGTGKSYVIGQVMRHLLRESGKILHILTVNQVFLAQQLAANLADIARKGLAWIVRWGGKHNEAPPLDAFVRLVRRAQEARKPLLLVSTTQSLISRFYQAQPDAPQTSWTLEPAVEELKPMLGVVAFDEAHHAPAQTYRRALNDLTDGSEAFLFGVTATPVNASGGVQEIFRNQGFWAYIDSVKKFLARFGSVARSVDLIMDQAAEAIDTGDLTPLRRFYAVNPGELAPDGSFFIRQNLDQPRSRFRINPDFYDKLIERFGPLFYAHERGFVAAANIEEAEALAGAFNHALPGRRFAVLHSGMSADDREAVLKDLRAGRINFVVTVHMLDEGLDFPNFTLYVDVNRGIGARQFIQRWGRLTRLYPGKQGVDVAVLMDPLDEEIVRENLVFLDRYLEGRFQGRQVRRGGDASPVLTVPTLAALDRVISREGLKALLANVRTFFTKDGSLIRFCNRFAADQHRLPREEDHVNAYACWRSFLREPPDLWPTAFSEEVKALMRVELERIAAARGISEFVEREGALPTAEDDARLHEHVLSFLGLPEMEWPPELSETARALLRGRRSIEALNAFVNEHEKLPTAAENEELFDLVRMLLANLDNLPLALSVETEVLLREASEALLLNAHVAQHGELPSEQTNRSLHGYVERLLSGPSSHWPKELEEEVRGLLEAEIARRRAVRRLDQFATELRRLPLKDEDDPEARELARALLETPIERWPADLSAHVVELLWDHIAREEVARALNARIDAGIAPDADGDWRRFLDEPEDSWLESLHESSRLFLRARREAREQAERLERFVLRKGRLPKAGEDHDTYRIVRGFLGQAETERPPELSERTRELLSEAAARIQAALALNAFMESHAGGRFTPPQDGEAARAWALFSAEEEALWPEELNSAARAALRARAVRAALIGALNRDAQSGKDIAIYAAGSPMQQFVQELLGQEEDEWPGDIDETARQVLRVAAQRMRTLAALEAFSESEGRLPSAEENEAAHTLWSGLIHLSEDRWPLDLGRASKGLMHEVVILIQKASALNQFVRLRGHLPSATENEKAHSLWTALLLIPEYRWPSELDDRVRNLIRSELMRLRFIQVINEFAENAGTLPSKEQHKMARRYLDELSVLPEAKWPVELRSAARRLLRAEIARVTQQKALFDGFVALVTSTGQLPSRARNPEEYEYMRPFLDMPEEHWPREFPSSVRKVMRSQIRAARQMMPRIVELLNSVVTLTGWLSSEELSPRIVSWYRQWIVDAQEDFWSKDLSEQTRRRLRIGAVYAWLARFCRTFAALNGELPSASDNKDAHEFLSAHARTPEENWPEEWGPDSIVAKLLRREVAALMKQEGEGLPAFNQFIRVHKRLPMEEDVDSPAYRYARHLLDQGESAWVWVSKEAKELLRAEIEHERFIRDCNDIVRETGKLPSRSNNEKAYVYLRGLMDVPQADWPKALSPELKDLMRARLEKAERLRGEALLFLNSYVAREKKLPPRALNPDAAWYLQWLLDSPGQRWPAELDSELASLMRWEIVRSRAVRSLNDFARRDAQASGLPSLADDREAYWYIRSLMDFPEDKWPAGLEEAARALMRAEFQRAIRIMPAAVVFLNDYATKHAHLPSEGDSPAEIFWYLNWLLDGPGTQWPETLSPAAKDLMRQGALFLGVLDASAKSSGER